MYMSTNNDDAVKKLLVPTDVKSIYSNKTFKYDPHKVQSIIIDIATTSDKIDDIAKRHGIDTKTIYTWRAASSQLLQAWLVAMEMRTHIMAEENEAEWADTKKIVEDKEEDPRYASVRTRFTSEHVKSRHWLMGKLNKRIYGDNMQIDQTLTISPSQSAIDAWSSHQKAMSDRSSPQQGSPEAVEAHYTVVEDNLNHSQQQ